MCGLDEAAVRAKPGWRDELTREFLTMALYLAIVIFAELIAIPDDDPLTGSRA